MSYQSQSATVRDGHGALARRWRVALGLGILTVCIAAYWPGLGGEFVLDDKENFSVLQAWLDGRIGLAGVLATNESGLFGRPLSMLSFAVTAQLSGMEPAAFKSTNLAIHLACALLMFFLAARLTALDPTLRNYRTVIAGLVATLWLLAPIQVSTVLYPVQRMSQLSGAFILLGLIAYAAGRSMLDETARRHRGLLLIYAVMPLCTLGAMLAKENGAVLPLLCAALELSVFRTLRRPRHLQFAYALGVLVSAAVLLVPQIFDRLVLQGYASRDFTLGERLLTQPRVLWDYVAAIVLPNGPRMGLIHDDFVVSRSLLSPPTTLLAILGWMAAVVGALAGARKAPLASAGVFLFLGAHAIESTVFPLEIYFEHRNYVASAGVWLALVAGSGYLLQRAQLSPAFRRTVAIVPVLFILVFAAATHARARAWASWDVLLAQAVLEQRDSPRLNAMYGASLLERGDLAGAIEYFQRVPRTGVYAPVVPMWIVLATCMAGETVDEDLVIDWQRSRPDTFAANAMQAVRALTEEIENNRCRGLEASRALAILEDWVTHLDTTQPRTRHWRMRYYAARLAAASGLWSKAVPYARDAALDSDDSVDALVLWFQIASSAQARDDARAALDRLHEVVPAWHYQLQEALQRFEASLATPIQPGPSDTARPARSSTPEAEDGRP
jgi:hypothetical protein